MAQKENDRLKKQKLRSEKGSDINDAVAFFRKNILMLPNYLCTSCRRTLYKSNVRMVQNCKFPKADSSLRTRCLTTRLSVDEKEWICLTCKRYLERNKIPPQSNANNMSPETIGICDALSDLTPLERRLISQRYPFMKLLALPKMVSKVQ